MLRARAAETRLALAAAGLLLAGGVGVRAGEKLAGGDYLIARHSLANAGSRSTGGEYLLSDTIGDVGVRTASGGAYTNSRGLPRLMAQPGSVVSITALTKSTGTLDLRWNSPGLDGGQGGVVGFYRVDFSSEPGHVFSPTTFQLEFATSVAPGDPQHLRLSDLEVNTTYYTKIYLAGPEKFFAEDSVRGAQSTFANVPLSPVVVSVGSTSVTLTWDAPAGGAEGFEANASSTNFGAQTPGGVTASSMTPRGQASSLTIPGLLPNTTYFLKVASLNWQGDRNYVVMVQIYTTPSGAPLPIVFLISVPRALDRSISFSWTNQPYNDNTGVLVLQSTSAATNEVVDGAGPFAPGQVLGDGSIVTSTSSVDSLNDSGLTLDSTYYYHFFSRASGLLYSVDVTTSVFLDLPPMAVANLGSEVTPDLTRITLSWDAVTSNLDGSLFKSTDTPLAVELRRYEIARSTTIINANFVAIATVSASAMAYTDTVPDPSLTYLYRVRAMDSFNTSEPAMVIDSTGDLYIFGPDEITHMRLPRRARYQLGRSYNSYASNIVLRATENNGDAAKNIFRSVLWQARKSPDNAPIERFEFAKPEIALSLHYDVAGGQVVVSSPSALAAPLAGGGAIAAATADTTLGMYWDNGAKYVKLFGKVDTQRQMVTIQGINAGNYQIRGVLRDQGLNFDVSQLSNKVITPNGDGRNDKAVFLLDNPRDAAFSGRVFDRQGAFVADLAPGVLPNSLQWDATGNGRVVPGGVYIYQIRGEGKTFSGALLVIR